MASPDMHSLFRDPVPPFHRKPSQESSPPPSPASHASQESRYADTQLRKHSLSSSGSSKPRPLVTDVIATRPRLPGRQETPPSPPNSVLASEAGISPATSSPGGTMGVTTSQPMRQSLESSANSLKDRFTRVFRGHKRGSSDNSWSTSKGYGRHRKENSTSTNTTTNPLALTHIQSASSKTSFQGEPDLIAGKQIFFDQSHNVSPVSVTNENYNRGAGLRRSSGRRIMKGGEVRIEIFSQPPAGVDERDKEDGGDRSMKYYDYYTRSKPSSPASEENGDDSIPEIDESQKFVPSLKPFEPGDNLTRNATTDTHSSSESRERRFLEDSVARRFEGFHFGGAGDSADSLSEELPRTDSEASSRPINANSRKASSNVLNIPPKTDPNHSRSHSSLARKNTGGSVARRPVLNRELSSSSYMINGRTVSAQSNDHTTEEVFTRELRRLSRISAGSGVSGLAIVVTADGPSSTKRSTDSDDDESYGHRWTTEEKGKARAASSEPSGTHGQRSHTRSLSGQSGWTMGTDNTHRTEDNSDSKSLLPAVPEILQSRKLKAQEPNNGALVHQGDPKYEFTYRMRQTPDDNAIFVPQYRYDAPLSFPHRNALGLPSLAKAPKTADGSTFSSTSLASRMGGSILKRPPSAMLRMDSPSGSSIPQGDFTFDSRPRTSYTEQYGMSKSHNDVDSLIHPALRNVPEKPGKIREAVSMSSMEMFGSGFRRDPFSQLGSRDSHDEISRGQRVAYDNLLQPPPATHRRSSWDPSRFLNQFPVRPKEFMRRSLTPHLYDPQDIALDDPMSGSEAQGDNTAHYQRQQKVGRMLLATCLLFPPLWFVIACGGFDTFVVSWTGGTVHGVGSLEKKIALVLATVVCIGAVIGVIVGVSVGATAAP